MKRFITIILLITSITKLNAQVSLPSYQAFHTSGSSGAGPAGSLEFVPTGSGSSPTNNQFVSVPASSNFEFTGDFTVECWVNFNNVSGVFQSFLGQYTSGVPWVLQLLPGGQLRLTGLYGGDVNANTLSVNTWYHIAVVRNGPGANCLKIYVNGVNVGQETITTPIGSATEDFTVGSGPQGDDGGNDRMDGLISNVRVVKGVAVYTGNFTPPTAPLTAKQINGTNISAITSGTVFLLNTSYNASFLKDNSLSKAIATNNQTVKSSPLNPFYFISAGMIVNLDATNPSSYPGTGNTWTNLGTGSTAYNATLVNTPTFETGTRANLYFNKATDADAEQYGTFDINTGAFDAFTIEVVAKIQGSWTTTPFVRIDDGIGYNKSGCYIGVQGRTINYAPSGINFQSYGFSNDTWYVITIMHSKYRDAFYLNGELQGEYNFPSGDNMMGANTINPLRFGNPPKTATEYKQQINISRFKFYNRELSIKEIGSNYSVQRNTYGIQ